MFAFKIIAKYNISLTGMLLHLWISIYTYTERFCNSQLIF
nr:MAG TPA: hypothetical protein [Caudoviricetes sp.]DAM73461.1 MAG TPA: hypothetical protein [Caudoviricetes sp.]DAZ19777.1 MAG TPA: hypothetical protein [Caudoviricetes sp.]